MTAYLGLVYYPFFWKNIDVGLLYVLTNTNNEQRILN